MKKISIRQLRKDVDELLEIKTSAEKRLDEVQLSINNFRAELRQKEAMMQAWIKSRYGSFEKRVDGAIDRVQISMLEDRLEELNLALAGIEDRLSPWSSKIWRKLLGIFTSVVGKSRD